MASNDRNSITLIETDEVNNPTATYVCTESQKQSNDGRKGRIDLLVSLYTVLYSVKSLTSQPSTSLSWSRANLMNILVDIFLPAGYPHSVTDDYLP